MDAGRVRAIKKALRLGGAQRVHRVRFGRYLVASESVPGREYTVTVDGPPGGTLLEDRYRCTCPAGMTNRPCWHQAAVWLAKLERNHHVRVYRARSDSLEAEPLRVPA